jgi:uncharacterized RDD family membrane protein YckC
MPADTPRTEISSDRDEAIRRLTARHHLQQSGISFLGLTVVLIVIWAVSGAGEFWPVFPILAFAFAFASQAVAVYTHKGITEQDIQKELARRGDSG